VANLDDSTLDGSCRVGLMDTGRQLGLMIACHPNLARIGEVSWLFDAGDSGVLDVDRGRPLFRNAGGVATGPLESAWVSRISARLRLHASGHLDIHAAADANWFVEETLVVGERRCEPSELERGLRLRLGRHVLLWLGMFERARFARREVPGLSGKSPAMEQLRSEIVRYCDFDEPVLIRGESGSGKERVAAALHALGTRASGPYVRVNMAAVPASVAVSELFGHGKGAFTGASAARSGHFADASGGTLLLDEIGQAAPEVQTVLLRVLESGVIQPVGAKLCAVDVRVLAATDADLERFVEQERFHGPLLGRFGCQIWVPPLRERRQDIPELFRDFLCEALSSFGESQRSSPPDTDRAPLVGAELMARLLADEWRGNVRELRNAARRIALLARDGKAVLYHEASGESEQRPSWERPAAVRGRSRARELSDQQLRDALQEHAFAVDAAASALGVSRSWLHARISRMSGVQRSTDLASDQIKSALLAAQGDLALAARSLGVTERALRLQMTRLRIAHRAD
jgi:two-component system nitrogen regulation response regulator GlnG